MKNLVGKLTRNGNLVMDFSARTRLTTKVCMLLDQHKKSVKYGFNSDLLSAAKPDFLLSFALQMLNPSSDTTESKEVRAAAESLKNRRR